MGLIFENHPLDFVLKLEEVENLTYVFRKAPVVADEVLRDVVWVALQLFKVERRVVVKTLPSCPIEFCVERVAFELAALTFFVLREYLLFGGCEHAIEPTQYRHGQHDTLVLRRAIWPT